MDSRKKILSWDALAAWRVSFRASGKKLAVTNGCFDLLHAGHVAYLEAARNKADALLVGLNGDDSVRRLKGEGRPLNSELDRAAVLAGLAAVDAVTIFPETEATGFLAAAEPDIYVKGGDYSLESLNPAEVKAVQQSGGRIVIIPFLEGRSTSEVIQKILRRT